MGPFVLPMVLECVVLHHSHGCLSMFHGKPFLSHDLHETWTRTIPWRCTLGEWDIMRVTDPSHGSLHTAHGPGMCCITLFPWMHISCPWVCTDIYVISHGVLFLAHGLHET